MPTTLEKRIEALEARCEPVPILARSIETFIGGDGKKWIRQVDGELVIEMHADELGELPSTQIIHAIMKGEEKPADLHQSAASFWDTVLWVNDKV